MSESPWFHPLTFMTHLPQKVRDMKNAESAFSLLHETIHYIQSTTTFTGIFRFIKYWDVYTTTAHLRSMVEDDLTYEQIQKIKRCWKKAYQEIIAFDPPITDRAVDIDQEENIPTGLQYLSLPDSSKAFAYIKKLVNNDYRAFFFDLQALHESMAFAYEIWIGKDIPYYDTIKASESPDLFQYIIGIETVKDITCWKNEAAAAGLTVFLADYALGHLSPSHAFINGARIIASRYSELSENSDFEGMYNLLSESLMFDEILAAYEQVNAHLEFLHNSSQNSDDNFDRAVTSMIGVMLKALEKRLNDPTFFTRHILTDFGNHSFLADFYIPLYLNQNEYIDTGIHPDRHNFVLFINILHHRLLTIVDPKADKRCPYLEKTVCGFEKTEECSISPWLRRFDDENRQEKSVVCLYRFVEHGLQHPTKCTSEIEPL